jgi:hypothetical protein
MVIGQFPGVSLADARDVRRKSRKLLSENIDPQCDLKGVPSGKRCSCFNPRTREGCDY